MRVAHLSDLHYGPRHLEEADRCFSAAVDRAIELAVDVAVISGDATDHALDLHAPAALRLLAQVRRLADHCPVLMLQGTWSHEPPGTLSVFRMLGSRHRVFVADRIGQVALMGNASSRDLSATDASAADLWLASEGPRFAEVSPGARAVFTCIPSINKAAVAAAVGATTAAAAQGERCVPGRCIQTALSRISSATSIGTRSGRKGRANVASASPTPGPSVASTTGSRATRGSCCGSSDRTGWTVASSRPLQDGR